MAKFTNPKNLRRGDLIAPLPKPDAKSTTVNQGRQHRVLSVNIPMVYVEVWDHSKWESTMWHINTEHTGIIRIHKNAVTPLAASN